MDCIDVNRQVPVCQFSIIWINLLVFSSKDLLIVHVYCDLVKYYDNRLLIKDNYGFLSPSTIGGGGVTASKYTLIGTSNSNAS